MDRADRIDMLLGQEHDAFVFDSRRAFDPNLLAAAAGTVCAGGLLIWLQPRQTSWKSSGTPFLHRLARRLERHVVPLPVCRGIATTRHASIAEATCSATAADWTRWEDEQNTLLARLLDWCSTSALRVLIVQGDRGRGKSALLGRLAQRLIADGLTPMITASRRSQLETLCRHATGNHSTLHSPVLSLLGADQALDARPGTLLIDEAAAFPLPLLLRLAAHHERLVLATTVKGYEGVGRGFALRFTRELDRRGIAWRRVVPRLPIRWAPGDPLETCLNDLLLLDLEGDCDQDYPSRQSGAVSGYTVHRLDRRLLARDDALLRTVVGILLQAHYRTTPQDVAHLLDEPMLEVWAACRPDASAEPMSQRIMGVVLIGFEGPLDAAWHDDILRRRRRPKHALMPQLLAQVLASTVPLTLAQARIVRIAVRPALQRRGIGSMLLSEIADQLSGRVALLGASFGEDADTVSFWRANGYTPIHRGYRRNARSGLKSVLMARALSHRAAQLIACAGHLLTDNQRALEARSGKVRFAELPADDELLRRFARGERSLVDSAGALRRFIDTDNRSTSTSTATGANNMADDEPDWLVDLFDRLAPGVRGRQARERALRRWLRAALAD